MRLAKRRPVKLPPVRGGVFVGVVMGYWG